MDKLLHENIEIGGEGVKSILAKFKPEEAIAEFIWNGFDANATEVNLDYDVSRELGEVEFIKISDNGTGIPQNKLNNKFKPFFESEKAKNGKDKSHHSLTHGKNGIGRLTFFTFANKACWTTRYEEETQIIKEYDIEIQSRDIENYTGSNTDLRGTNEKTGTVVEFTGINKLNKYDFEGKVLEHLRQEFGWFLEIFSKLGYSLNINGNKLDYSKIIGDRDSITLKYAANDTQFNLGYIRWNTHLKNEYSRFYLLNSKGKEIWKDTTKLNNKGDSFYHSIFVKSDYFDNFTYDEQQSNGEITLFGHSKEDEEYKYIEEEITNYLRKKRKPFLKEFAEQLVNTYENEGIMPTFQSEWDKPRREELRNVIKNLYEVEPKIFSQSSIEQKKTFVRLLNTLLDTEDRERILQIIKEVVDLDEQEQTDLLDLLKATKLDRIISTIKFIQNRYKTIDELKAIVFDKELKGNERDHIQKSIDFNYWIFGEQYHLLSTTEAKFDTALRQYTSYLTESQDIIPITHIDKNKEMDIFMCRQMKGINKIENIVVELKSPSVNLGEKEVSQVKKYMSVILSTDQFNSDNTYWEFILVGNRFDSSGYIEGELENSKGHGERNNGLIFKNDKYRIYVKKWSEIFEEFEIRHKFIEEKLEIARDSIASNYSSADEIIQIQQDRSQKVI